MKSAMLGLAAAAALGTAPATAQAPGADSHVAAARTAAGSDFQGLFTATCGGGSAAAAPARGATGTATTPSAARAGAPATPAREQWYAPPQKVFDNLYWLGTKEHSAWALTTSQGIILIDTLYAYAVEPEIVDGLKTLGFDPATIKYVIVSHGHGDHDQGARLLQDRYKARVVMGAADWDAVERTPNMPGGGAPRRDIAVTATQTLTLGDTSVTIVPTPGHTLGTLSLIFPVKDKGRTLTVAYSGGTAFNFAHTAERFDTYVASQQGFAKAVGQAKASVILSNHSAFDHALEKAAIAQKPRRAGEAHPFELGAPAVSRYLKVLEECAVGTRIKEFGSQPVSAH